MHQLDSPLHGCSHVFQATFGEHAQQSACCDGEEEQQHSDGDSSPLRWAEGRGLMSQVYGSNQEYPCAQTDQFVDVEDQSVIWLPGTAHPKTRKKDEQEEYARGDRF